MRVYSLPQRRNSRKTFSRWITTVPGLLQRYGRAPGIQPDYARKSTCLVLVLILALVGCTVGPDYSSPDIRLPAAWDAMLEQPDLPSRSELAGYWTELSDPVLNQLIARALEHNEGLQGTALAIDEALARYRVQRAEFFPDIDLSAQVQRRRRSAAIASALSDLHNDYGGAGGLLGWEIDILGRVRRLTESARADIAASVELYHGAIVTLLSEVTLAYTRYRTLETSIALTNENIRIQRDSLAVARNRFAAGIAPELDVRQAESNLGETEATLPLLRLELARQRNMLAVLCGGYAEVIEAELSGPGSIPELPDLAGRKLPLHILRQRPDLRRAERQLAAQHALIGAAEAQLYPIVSLPGSFTFEALNTLEQAFRADSLAYSIGPRVDLNFLDFGRVRGNIAVQNLRTQQIEQQYRQLVYEAVQEVENALAALEEQQIRRAYLDESVKASQKAAELVKSLYVSGLTDFQNVLDSERRLFSQQLSLAESSGDRVEAFVLLYRSLGGGWQHLGAVPETAAEPEEKIKATRISTSAMPGAGERVVSSPDLQS